MTSQQKAIRFIWKQQTKVYEPVKSWNFQELSNPVKKSINDKVLFLSVKADARASVVRRECTNCVFIFFIILCVFLIGPFGSFFGADASHGLSSLLLFLILAIGCLKQTHPGIPKMVATKAVGAYVINNSVQVARLFAEDDYQVSVHPTAGEIRLSKIVPVVEKQSSSGTVLNGLNLPSPDNGTGSIPVIAGNDFVGVGFADEEDSFESVETDVEELQKGDVLFSDQEDEEEFEI